MRQANGSGSSAGCRLKARFDSNLSPRMDAVVREVRTTKCYEAYAVGHHKAFGASSKTAAMKHVKNHSDQDSGRNAQEQKPSCRGDSDEDNNHDPRADDGAQDAFGWNFLDSHALAPALVGVTLRCRVDP